MKKTMMILALAMLLSLAGCGMTEQWQQVKTEYIEPAIEKAQTGVDPNAVDQLAVGPNISTDWSKLTEYVTVENVGGRISEDALEELTPAADYGRLLPYIGGYATADDGSVAGSKYGLITEDGRVVLDPVLTVLYTASYFDAAGDVRYLDVFVMGRQVAIAGGETEESVPSIRYAVCGADGSWSTGFDYTEVCPMELGVLCVSDEKANLGVCYDETGKVVFDTAEIGYTSYFKENTITGMANCGSGLMTVTFKNGSVGFMDTRGYILNQGTNNTSYFSQALGFREGLCAVSNGGLWSYIDSTGAYVAFQKFEAATSFVGGVAAAKKSGGGNWVAIDKSGEVLKEFEGAASVKMGDGWLCVTDGSGSENYYSTPAMTALSMYSIPATPYSGGMWVKGTYGVRAKTSDGVEIFFSGASELLGHVNNERFLVRLMDGTCAVMDTDGRAVMAGETLGFVTDAATGGICIYDAEGSSVKLYNADGTLMADHAFFDDILGGGGVDHSAHYGPIDGYTMCEDGSSVGWKNAENQWIFRLKVDYGD